MKIKIISDGTPKGTVVRLENGERLEQVTGVEFWAEMGDEFCGAVLKLRRVSVELEAELDATYIEGMRPELTRKAGDQGITLQTVGSHQTDPFAAQDPVFTDE